MSELQTTLSLLLGTAFIGTVFSQLNPEGLGSKVEHFGQPNDDMSPEDKMRIQEMKNRLKQKAGSAGAGFVYPAYPVQKQFYARENAKANAFQAARAPLPNVQSNRAYAGPNGAIPQSQANISLNASGDQLLEYQLYQQAVNAATPTLEQLNSISGNSQDQTGNGSSLKGGVSSNFAPYGILGSDGPQYYSSEFQAVNMGNARAQQISACAQNAPTFIATSLLPKPMVPGMDSWSVGAPQNILANQNFLAATQQIGIDTVLSSLKNPSYDIRSNIPNPINVVSPWANSSITPDLSRRPLDAYIPDNGLYGANVAPVGTYVGMSD